MTDNKNIPGTQLISGEQSQRIFEGLNRGTVSYTHLTLPTIYSV